jgi:hypothetical protein
MSKLELRLQKSNTRAANAELRVARDRGTVPSTCPFDGCKKYVSKEAVKKNGARAFEMHLKVHHQCKYCKKFVATPKSVHERYCKKNPYLTESDDEQ